MTQFNFSNRSSRFKKLTSFSLPAIMLALACSPGVDTGDDTTGGGSNKGGDGDGDSGLVFPGDEGSGGGGNAESAFCSGEQKDASHLPPDLLILLDRSGSMIENNVEGGANSRWVEATEALSTALRDTQAGINWGLKLYPDDDWCGVSQGANVEVGSGTAESIITEFLMTPPKADLTHTPTRAAVVEGLAYLQTLQTDTPKAIVLVTDGEPNCGLPLGLADGDRDVEAPIAAVAQAAAAGIPVYVVGFSISKEQTEATLNSLAEAGGKQKDNPFKKYYTAENDAEFQAAMREISADAASCTFDLTDPPAGKDVTIYLFSEADQSTEEIPEDPTMTNGWAYSDADTIEIYGPSCDLVRNSWDRVLKSGYGCTVVK